MLTTEECRKLLGEDGKSYTDQQIIEIREWLMRLADIAIEAERKNDHLTLNQLSNN